MCSGDTRSSTTHTTAYVQFSTTHTQHTTHYTLHTTHYTLHTTHYTGIGHDNTLVGQESQKFSRTSSIIPNITLLKLVVMIRLTFLSVSTLIKNKSNMMKK
jgi:hypothetical protein